MKEVIKKTWCDIHLQRDDARIDASFSGVVTVAARGGVVVRKHIDLCEEHENEVLGSMLTTVNTFGALPDDEEQPRAVRGASRFDGEQECPLCPSVLDGRKGLRNHFVRMHDQKLVDWEREQARRFDLVSA